MKVEGERREARGERLKARNMRLRRPAFTPYTLHPTLKKN